MHPVLVSAPGVLFKLAAPCAILWGLYSLIVAYNRRALRVSTGDESTGSGMRAPADSPANAAIAIVVGVGLFLFAAPVAVTGSTPLARLGAAIRVFGRSVIDGHVWAASWQPLAVHSYGVMLGASLILGWYITRHYALRQDIPHDVIVDCYIVTALAAFAGSRALYVVTNLSDFRDAQTHRLSLTAMLALRTGGLVAYGGFLGGLVGSWAYLRRRGLPFWRWGDAASPSLAAGLMVTTHRLLSVRLRLRQAVKRTRAGLAAKDRHVSAMGRRTRGARVVSASMARLPSRPGAMHRAIPWRLSRRAVLSRLDRRDERSGSSDRAV